MKKLMKYMLLGLASLCVVACENIDTLNIDPNNPSEVPSNMLMSGAQKWIMDNIYDNWFSGRNVCFIRTIGRNEIIRKKLDISCASLPTDRQSPRRNSSHIQKSRMQSSA